LYWTAAAAGTSACRYLESFLLFASLHSRCFLNFGPVIGDLVTNQVCPAKLL
jgi:hypothetical protein